MTRERKILNGAGIWAGYYRSNPHRFAHDYLNLNLRLFQKILLLMMNISVSFVFIASRGLGKTFLSAVFCCIRCILYPGTKVCIASGTKGQSINVLEKIMQELVPLSPQLALEIDQRSSSLSVNNARIIFKNGSFIKVVAASDSARGNRANILLIDEYRLVAKDIIDTILRKFLSNAREPKYLDKLSKAEREAKLERNRSLFLSSAYFKDHWSFIKAQDNCRFMLSDKKKDFFVCGFPYQIAIKEGLLPRADVEDQMAESDFNEVKWAMEMDAEFLGDVDGAFFKYSTISENRKIKHAMLPDSVSRLLGTTSRFKIAPKGTGEIRILSADIALMMSGKKKDNDATAIFINQMLPNRVGRFTSNIIYSDSYEGLHTEDQALIIRKMYSEFSCDYIALDCTGLGLGVYDALAKDMTDPETGEILPALSCINMPDMAARCKVSGADKVIWAIKANATLNSDCAVFLREGFKSGKIRLLIPELDFDTTMLDTKAYKSLTPAQKLKVQAPYIHTTLLIDEMIKLDCKEVDGKFKLSEKAGKRKDRYSSLSYNYYVALQIENKYNKKNRAKEKEESFFMFSPPKIK